MDRGGKFLMARFIGNSLAEYAGVEYVGTVSGRLAKEEKQDDFAEFVEITRDIAAIIKTYRKAEQRRIIAWLLHQPVSDQIKRDTLQAYEAQWLAGRRISDEWAEAIYRNRSF
jgi:hypothetical protein